MNKIKSYAIRTSFALNGIVVIAALVGILAVKSNAAEGYVKVSANFGSPTTEKIEIADLAMQAMPLPARKPR